MIREWAKVRIGDVAEVYDGPHATPKKTNYGPIFLGINTLENGRLDLSDVEYLSEEDFAQWTRRVTPSAEDVVFSYETRIGQAAIVPPGLRCCLGRRMGLVRTNPAKLDARFFLYQYLSPGYQAFLLSRTIHGSTVDRIPLRDFPDFLLALPPIDEQRAIAHILGTLDDKIELNRRMNETLEATARAIFKSWFVDFDPVRAKASGEPADSICHRLGLTPDLLAFFPNSFQGSELGEIPSGWKYLPAEDVADIGIGKTPPRKEPQWFTNNPNDIPWVSIRDMGESGTFIHSTSEFLTDEAVRQFNVRIVPTHTVLLSFKLTIGRVTITDGEMVTNEAIAHFKLPKGSAFSSEFLYLYLKSFDYSRLGSTSSIADAINSRTVKGIPVLIPSDEVLHTFWNISSDLFAMIRQNQSQSKALATIRDTILPRLMSGELRADSSLLHGDA